MVRLQRTQAHASTDVVSDAQNQIVNRYFRDLNRIEDLIQTLDYMI